MTSNSPSKRLILIFLKINSISSNTKKNTMLKRAIERDLEIIGEAVRRIVSKDDSFAIKISNAKSIVGLRNQVIHAYDNISDENIWSILLTHIPKLKIEIDELISNKTSN